MGMCRCFKLYHAPCISLKSERMTWDDNQSPSMPQPVAHDWPELCISFWFVLQSWCEVCIGGWGVSPAGPPVTGKSFRVVRACACICVCYDVRGNGGDVYAILSSPSLSQMLLEHKSPQFSSWESSPSPWGCQLLTGGFQALTALMGALEE